MDARIIIAAFLFLGSINALLAADPPPPQKESMILRAYRIEPGFFSEPDPASKNGERRAFDAQKYLESMKVPFPPGAQATYDQASQCIVIRQTTENMEAVENILLPTCCGPSVQLQCEISAYRLPPKLTASLPKKGNLSPSDLKQLEQSGHLLDRLLGIVQSGQEAEFAKHTGNDTSRFHIQPTIGADGTTVDVQLDYRLGIPSAGKEKPLELKSPVRVEDGHSVVVQAATVPENIAVVLRVRIVNSCGWSLDEAYPPQ